MTYDLFFFEQTIARPKMLYKLNYKNVYDLPTIQKIKINLSLKENKKGTDYKVIQSMDILELISNQRPFLEKIEKIRHQNIMFSLVCVNLRRLIKWNFFWFIIFFLIPLLEQRYIVISYKVNKYGVFNLNIKDLMLFPKIVNRYFGWRKGINVNFFTTSLDVVSSKIYFNVLFNKKFMK